MLPSPDEELNAAAEILPISTARHTDVLIIGRNFSGEAALIRWLSDGPSPRPNGFWARCDNDEPFAATHWIPSTWTADEERKNSGRGAHEDANPELLSRLDLQSAIAAFLTLCQVEAGAVSAATAADAIRRIFPNCEGYMRPIRVKAPLGSIVNPRPYAACAARGIIAYRMLDTCFAALSAVIPNSVPAGGEGGPTAISFSGVRKDTGEQWLITDSVLGSWGARREKDGVEGISSPGANLSNQPIEIVEARLPLRVEEYAFVCNSGGAGVQRGGLAVSRSYRILDDSTRMTLRSDRRKNLPLALEGGMQGSPSYNIIRHEGS